jgi:hypothetical protein
VTDGKSIPRSVPGRGALGALRVLLYVTPAEGREFSALLLAGELPQTGFELGTVFTPQTSILQSIRPRRSRSNDTFEYCASDAPVSPRLIEGCSKLAVLYVGPRRDSISHWSRE